MTPYYERWQAVSRDQLALLREKAGNDLGSLVNGGFVYRQTPDGFEIIP